LGEMVLTALHPGVSVEDARQATGWPLKEVEQLDRSEPPMPDELAALRALDPARVFLDRGA
jgi:glutaconate CoA-transferase subunit B